MKDNQFVTQINVPFPHGERGRRLEQWINQQHAGKPRIPLDEEVSEEHTKAHNAVHTPHRICLLVEVNKDGTWRFLEILEPDDERCFLQLN